MRFPSIYNYKNTCLSNSASFAVFWCAAFYPTSVNNIKSCFSVTNTVPGQIKLHQRINQQPVRSAPRPYFMCAEFSDTWRPPSSHGAITNVPWQISQLACCLRSSR